MPEPVTPRPDPGRLRRPELVIFDVDGTLHDTFAWWAPVIRRGVTAFGEREGIEIPEFTDRFAEAVVGMKDAGVWGPFLPAEHKHRWSDLREAVIPMEVAEISSGRDYLFPGVRPLLAHLRRLDVALALASNCRQGYMDGIRHGQGLAELTEHQLCLDSPGVGAKPDMLRLAVQAARRTRPALQRAVMVGDREPDLEAARDQGQPFVWRRNDRCDLAAASDGIWDGDPDQLLDLLELPRLGS
jgi:phosphoglycolate phosphatase-like HAD superfamily hydrolase